MVNSLQYVVRTKNYYSVGFEESNGENTEKKEPDLMITPYSKNFMRGKPRIEIGIAIIPDQGEWVARVSPWPSTILLEEGTPRLPLPQSVPPLNQHPVLLKT